MMITIQILSLIILIGVNTCLNLMTVIVGHSHIHPNSRIVAALWTHAHPNLLSAWSSPIQILSLSLCGLAPVQIPWLLFMAGTLPDSILVAVVVV